jgi:hypothetical protein
MAGRKRVIRRLSHIHLFVNKGKFQAWNAPSIVGLASLREDRAGKGTISVGFAPET